MSGLNIPGWLWVIVDQCVARDGTEASVCSLHGLEGQGAASFEGQCVCLGTG